MHALELPELWKTGDLAVYLQKEAARVTFPGKHGRFGLRHLHQSRSVPGATPTLHVRVKFSPKIVSSLGPSHRQTGHFSLGPVRKLSSNFCRGAQWLPRLSAASAAAGPLGSGRARQHEVVVRGRHQELTRAATSTQARGCVRWGQTSERLVSSSLYHLLMCCLSRHSHTSRLSVCLSRRAPSSSLPKTLSVQNLYYVQAYIQGICT